MPPQTLTMDNYNYSNNSTLQLTVSNVDAFEKSNDKENTQLHSPSHVDFHTGIDKLLETPQSSPVHIHHFNSEISGQSSPYHKPHSSFSFSSQSSQVKLGTFIPPSPASTMESFLSPIHIAETPQSVNSYQTKQNNTFTPKPASSHSICNQQTSATINCTSPNKQTKQQVVDGIIELYSKYGSADYIGELVNQTEHMTQAAALARKSGYRDAVIVAALLHDIGHLLPNVEQSPGLGTKDHETVAAEFLRSRGFSSEIVQLVSQHVNAKRYLVSIHPQYHTSLSGASQATLKLQGGQMNDNERQKFESDPLFDDYLCMRRLDEAAKEVNVVVPGVESYRQLIEKFIV